MNIDIRKILKNDKYFVMFGGSIIGIGVLTILALVSIKVFGGFRVESGILKEDAIPFILTLFILVAFFCLLGILYRYLYFRNIISKQLIVKGIVNRLYFDKDNDINIEFSYEYLGSKITNIKEMAGSNYYIPPHLRDGSEIKLLINPQSPKQYIIVDLYTYVL